MTRILAIAALLSLRVLTAEVATDIARQIQTLSLDPAECYRVTELNFSKEDIKIYLSSGYMIFSKPIAGFRQSAVFVTSSDGGDAEILLMPPTRSERLSLATFTHVPNLEEHFKMAAFLFTDATAADLLARIDANPSFKKSEELGNVLADQWNSVLRNLSMPFETSLVQDSLTTDRKSGFFYMAVAGNTLGNFDVLYAPLGQEQVFLGKLAYRDSRAYFDSWSSFPSRSVRNRASAPPVAPELNDFRIDSTIADDLTMKSVTRARLILKQPTGPLRFSISPSMHVTAASIDGAPVEIFSRDSLRGNLAPGNGDSDFLLIPNSPLDPAKPHEVEIHHEGAVIRKAGDGVYYVNARGTWYPRLGADFADYDLTFRFPRALTLVATGDVVEDRTEGNTHIVRRKSSLPIRFAGFNLGDFQSVAIPNKDYKIEVYANRRLEAALQPKAPPMPIPPPAPQPRMRRDIPPIITPELAPSLPPDPAGRLAQIEKDVVDTLDFMTAQFGPPATRTLAITPIPATFGQGFPGLVYLSTLAYLNPEQRPARLHASYPEVFYSELLETHEIAHQWWGNLVTPASYRDEWLVESMANYCALLLLEKKKGVKALNEVLDDYRVNLLAKDESGHTLESAGPITWGRRLESSLSPNAWQVVAYQKGTWIMHMLRRQLGDRNFYSLLHDVAQRYRLSPISTAQFRELAQAYSPAGFKDRTLGGFFDNWVDGTGIPNMKLSYTWRAGKITGTITQSNVADDFSVLVPVEVQTAKQRTIYWLPTGSDPVPFTIPSVAAPARVALASNDALIVTAR